MPYICSRDSDSLTGRRTALATSAVRMTCGHARPAPPKPPPTKGDRTRTLPAWSPKARATWLRTLTGHCVLSYSVRVPAGDHTAMVACGSMGLWCSAGTT